MSHIQKIKSAFVDITSLRAALASFGWALESNTVAKTYPGDPKRGTVYDYVAVNPDTHGYDLGFKRSDNDVLETFGDFYGGSLEQAFGKDLCSLKRAYSKDVFTREWESQGYLVSSEVADDGSIMMSAELV